MAPRAAANVHADHSGGDRRADVVVHAVAHVRDLRRLHPGEVDDSSEERRVGLVHAPTLGRADRVEPAPQVVLDVRRRVPGRTDAVAGGAQACDAGERVGIPVVQRPRACRMLDAEQLPNVVVVAADRDRGAETGHQGERRHAAGLRDARPHIGLVDECLADVEHRLLRQPCRHAVEVGAGRHLEEPLIALDDLDAAAVRLDEDGQSDPSAPPRRAARSADATKHCGVLHRDELIAHERLVHRVVAHALHGVDDRQPRHRAVETFAERARAHARSRRPGAAGALRRGRGSPQRRRNLRDTARTDSSYRVRRLRAQSPSRAQSSSASRIAGSSHSGGATRTTASIQSAPRRAAAAAPRAAAGRRGGRTPSAGPHQAAPLARRRRGRPTCSG